MDRKLSDTEKIGLLYELYENDMYRVCISILGDSYLAEDALHDSFLKLIRRRGSITDPMSDKCKRFAMKTAKNTAIDMYRRRKREINYYEGIPEEDIASGFNVEDVYMTLIEPEKELIASLGVKYRNVVECICVQGLNTKETAAVLMISEPCVRKRLERARRMLLSKYGK